MIDTAAKVEVQPWMKEAAADIWPDNNPAFQAIGITASESVAVINMQQWERIAEIISRHAPAPDLTTHLAKYRDAMDAIYNDSEAGRELVTKHFGLTHPVVEPDAPAPEWEQDTDPNPELPPNPPVITIAGGKESDGSEQKKSGTDHAPGHFAYWVSGPIWVIVLFVLLYFAWRPLMRHGKIWFVESSTSAGELHQFCSKRVRVTFDAPGAKVGDFAVFSRTSAGTLHDIGRMPLENEPNYEIASVNGTQGEICSMIWN